MFIVSFEISPSGGTLTFDNIVTNNCPPDINYKKINGTYNWIYTKSGYPTRSGQVTVNNNSVLVNISL